MLHQKTALYVPNVKFSSRSVLCVVSENHVFHVSAFWLEIAYIGLNFDDLW